MSHPHLHQYASFTDEVHFTHDEVNNTRNSYLWLDVKPYSMAEMNFQYKFSSNMWCGTTKCQLICQSILPEYVQEDFLQYLVYV
jgi:hypothetical protein